MNTIAEKRFRDVLERAASDPEYQNLQKKFAELDPMVLAALDKLPGTDRTAVLDYIRVLGTSALRLTELACEHP